MNEYLTVQLILTLEGLRAHREMILMLAQQHGAAHVRVFGSVARGNVTPASDIDLLVRWDYARISPWGGVGLDLALQALLGVQVDIVSEAGLSPLVRDQILAEAVPL